MKIDLYHYDGRYVTKLTRKGVYGKLISLSSLPDRDTPDPKVKEMVDLANDGVRVGGVPTGPTGGRWVLRADWGTNLLGHCQLTVRDWGKGEPFMGGGVMAKRWEVTGQVQDAIDFVRSASKGYEVRGVTYARSAVVA